MADAVPGTMKGPVEVFGPRKPLLSAAANTPGVVVEPKPFVLQTELSDFYVAYELNAYTKTPNSMARVYSDLHQNIQDEFNTHGVQIMSPQYLARATGPVVVAPEHWHAPPAEEAPRR